MAVKQSIVNGSRRTKVRISHKLPAPGGPAGRVWHVSTEIPHRLVATQFDPIIARVVNSASRVKGRVVYCFDGGEGIPLAALAYHLDPAPRRPVLITAIALRVDGDEALYFDSVSAALVLKAFLHAVGVKGGRGEFVEHEAQADASTDQILRQVFKFQRVGAPRKTRVPGNYYRQSLT